MLISRKGKYFSVFGCISKNFPENIFWCLEKKKENTNPEKHKPQPRKKSSTTTNPVRRPRRQSQSEIAIDGAISRRRDRNLREIVIDGAILRSVNHDLRSSSLAYIRDLAIDASRDCDQRRLECLPARSRSARTGARSSPVIVGLTGMFLLLSRARALSLSIYKIFGNTLKGK